MKPGQRVGRKEPCPCGSGVKYKSCCFADDREAVEGKRAAKKSLVLGIFGPFPGDVFGLTSLWKMAVEKVPYYKMFRGRH